MTGAHEAAVPWPRVVVQLLLVLVGMPLLPILVSWRWDWWQAWLYAGTVVAGFVASRALVARRHPDLLRERARFMQHANAKSWDRILAPAVALGGVLPLAVCGLDARFGWSSTLPWAVAIAGLIAHVAGYVLGTLAMMANRFFSGLVRIQTDREHHVVSTGPYAWIRHPGYLGSLLSYWGTPLFLESWWALVPTLLVTIVLVVRTILEDRTLQEELPGYREYAARVRYRLIPGVW
ncbi:MAG: isoprenylcysteine carboxylmethyltransferase family protein [Sandaracinaceae bacterium]|nr:isoprenylcysteine carboxylmethyltransferase family protein [Sandaracinaceae bacterium]